MNNKLLQQTFKKYPKLHGENKIEMQNERKEHELSLSLNSLFLCGILKILQGQKNWTNKVKAEKM